MRCSSAAVSKCQFIVTYQVCDKWQVLSKRTHVGQGRAFKKDIYLAGDSCLPEDYLFSWDGATFFLRASGLR